MPYHIAQTPERVEMRATPHQSLSRRGFVLFIGITSAMFLLPSLALIGSTAWWGILPFLVLAIAMVWYFLNRSHKDRTIQETLIVTRDLARLERINPNGTNQSWDANPYWVQVKLVTERGPVPNYITLTGGERLVEIGTFLSEEERVALAQDLGRVLPWRLPG